MVFPLLSHLLPPFPTPKPSYREVKLAVSRLLSVRSLGSRLKGSEGKAVWIAQPTDETIRLVETARYVLWE